MEETCQLLFTGEILPTFDSNQVRSNLCQLLKKDPSYVEKLFERAPLIVVKETTRTNAEKWETALQRAGAGCKILPILSDDSGASAEKSPVIEASKSTEEKTTSISYEEILDRYRSQLECKEIQIAPHIPHDRVVRAYINFEIDRKENILLLVDTTNRQNVKNGLVLTDKKIYGRKIALKPQAIDLKDVKSVGVKKGFVNYLLINETIELSDIPITLEKKQEPLYHLFMSFIELFQGDQKSPQALGEVKEQQPKENETESVDALAALEWISFSGLLKLFAADLRGWYFLAAPDIEPKLLGTFMEALGIADQAVKSQLLFNAKGSFTKCTNGLLLTEDMLYGLDNEKIPRSISFDEVKSIKYARVGDKLLMINGEVFFRLESDDQNLFPHIVQLLLFRCKGDYNKNYMAKILSKETHALECPQCQSTDLRHPFKIGKGFVASMIVGGLTGIQGLGYLAGAAVADSAGKAYCVCNRCQHRWKIEPMPNPFE